MWKQDAKESERMKLEIARKKSVDDINKDSVTNCSACRQDSLYQKYLYILL
jgi:hypothetical protein